MTYHLIIDGTIFGIQQNGRVSKYLIEILIAKVWFGIWPRSGDN